MYLQTCLLADLSLFTGLSGSKFHGTKRASTKINNSIEICKHGRLYSNSKIRHSTVNSERLPRHSRVTLEKFEYQKKALEKQFCSFIWCSFRRTLVTSRAVFESKPNVAQNCSQPIRWTYFVVLTTLLGCHHIGFPRRPWGKSKNIKSREYWNTEHRNIGILFER